MAGSRPGPPRRPRPGPLVLAAGTCAAFAALGALLVGDALGGWYEGLEKPAFLVPLPVFYAVGTVYYVLFATVLYRVLTRLRDRRAPALGLTLGVLLLNELWNWAFLGLRSTLAGFVGILVFAVPLSALFLVLRGREPLSAGLVAAYGLWVLYDLAWAFALWRLNGA